MWANDIHYSTCVHMHVTYPYPTHTSQVFGPCLLVPVVMTLSLVEVEWAILSSVDISTRESDSGTWGIYVLIETVCLLHAVYNVFDLYYRTATPNDIALQGKVTSLDLFPGKNYSFFYPVCHIRFKKLIIECLNNNSEMVLIIVSPQIVTYSCAVLEMTHCVLLTWDSTPSLPHSGNLTV